MTDRRNAKRDDARRLVTGTVPPARAAAARSVFRAVGLEVDEADELTWRIGEYLYRPATELWTGPGGAQGYGIAKLVGRLKKPGSQTG